MEPRFFKIPVCVGDVSLNVAKGHFATRNSHTNYFVDVTSQQSCIRDAEAAAQQLAQRLTQHLMVDTILCMDGTRVIGTCLAQKLTQGGFRSINAGREIYVLREHLGTNGIVCIEYYRGSVVGIAAIYSHLKEIDGISITSLFDTNDLPGYASYLPEECPMCRDKQELDAVVDKFGYSAL